MSIQKKIKHFNEEPVLFVESTVVSDGVACDVYSFTDTKEKDLAIVTVSAGHKTPLQKVIKGTHTVEGHINGEGTLVVNEKTYSFPNSELHQVTVRVGDTMQWTAKTELQFYEICYPPYQDGRFVTID